MPGFPVVLPEGAAGIPFLRLLALAHILGAIRRRGALRI
jgi:hypothetical protein